MSPSGRCYHLDPECRGLNAANSVEEFDGADIFAAKGIIKEEGRASCKFCCADIKNQGDDGVAKKLDFKQE